jgi:hypothetical protein
VKAYRRRPGPATTDAGVPPDAIVVIVAACRGIAAGAATLPISASPRPFTPL